MSDEQEQGARAAWGYLKLAARALLGNHRLPELSAASRVYLLTMWGLYGYFALVFFLYVPSFGSGESGVDLVDAPVLHVLWTIALATVSLGQLAVLLLDHPALWRIAAVWTVMVAAALQVLFVDIAVTHHSYGGLPLWLAFVIIHTLFVGNNLVPIKKHIELAPEDKHLLDALGEAIHAPSPANELPAAGRLGHRSRRSTAQT